MTDLKNLPTEIPIFPLSNFIIFPGMTVPLNIFEPRYIDMINDSMKSDKLIGMIQPKNSLNKDNNPELYEEYRQKKREWGKLPKFCEICNRTLTNDSWSRHTKTKIHLENIEKKK